MWRRRGLALAAALSLNGLAVGALGVYRARVETPAQPEPTLTIELERPHRRPSAQMAIKPPLARISPSAASESAAAPTSAVHPAVVAAPPGPVVAAAPFDPDADMRAKVAEALKHLQGCAQPTVDGPHDTPGCRGRAHGEAGLDDIASAHRDEFDVDRRRADALHETNAELQRQTFHARGSAARYGCAIRDGKLQCATY